MAENTEISWTDATFNPWLGCTKVSEGCSSCYAEALMDHRYHKVMWGPGNPRVRTGVKNWNLPKRWNAKPFYECTGCGWRGEKTKHGFEICATKDCFGMEFKPARRRVFCSSLADVFDNEVDPAWRADLFQLIRDTPNLDWLLLTKRIGNARVMLEQAFQDTYKGEVPMWWHSHPLPNVWLGATIVNQEEADRDIPKLLAVPARVRFLSIEPLLGPISFEGMFASPNRVNDGTNALETLDWVIVGGESGNGARPMHPNWARSLRDQCDAAAVPYHFKQWGEWGPDWEGAETCSYCGKTKFDAINAHGECGHCGVDDWLPASTPLDTPRRVGKKAAGRELDGRTHNEFPRSPCQT